MSRGTQKREEKSYRDGKHYRERAEECRNIAEQFLQADPREKMLKVARDYEQLADHADKLAAVTPRTDRTGSSK
jgi:hypothetical protein